MPPNVYGDWTPGRGFPAIRGIASLSPRPIRGIIQPRGNVHSLSGSFGRGFQSSSSLAAAQAVQGNNNNEKFNE